MRKVRELKEEDKAIAAAAVSNHTNVGSFYQLLRRPPDRTASIAASV